MNIRDIVNRDIVNLSNCEHEPIHIPGSIQPHGFLLGLDETSHQIVFCSGNTSAYITHTYQGLLGKTFSEVFGDELEKELTQYISASENSTSPLLLTIHEKQFTCLPHTSGKILVLDIEPFDINDNNFTKLYDQTRLFLSYMEGTRSLQELCQLVAEGTRDITGYDRVMVYRFDAAYNGEVIAESKRDDLEPFLGLHYPHTDIPPQARALYMKNLLRVIVDVGYEPVPIYTIDTNPDANLDLGLSVLRSTSPIHVQYLHNMGVGGTLTISLLHNDKLWGLIACHHYSAKNLSPNIRTAAKLQGHFITSQIDVRQSNEEYDIAKRSNSILEQLLAMPLENAASSLYEIISTPLLPELCNATGVVICLNGNHYKQGAVPANNEIDELAAWLSAHTHNTHFQTSNLAALMPEAAQISSLASGIIYCSLGVDNNNCIIWFRSELVKEVNWAGDPTKAIIKNEKGLSPRNSFQLWKEIVKSTSKPWIQAEIEAANSFAHALQKHVYLLAITEEEKRSRKLAEVLKETNQELENINWISTHDLQEPLRKIQIISSRILSIEEAGISQQVTDMIGRMNLSAGRMQSLLNDILTYSRIAHTPAGLKEVDLNEVARQSILTLDENITEKNAIIETGELPVINGVDFLLRQLFTNLVSNSLKFSSPQRAPLIRIYADKDLQKFQQDSQPNALYKVIHVSDNGIGFDQKYADSVFKIFARLHNQEVYQGSGVGLALCKKIMQTHKGYITADGKENEGVVFSLYFPV